VRLRLAAGQRGTTYVALRLDVLEFLDATADTLTVDNLAEFIQPRIARWDVDLETGVLRVALRTQEPRERGGRAPNRGRPVAAPPRPRSAPRPRCGSRCTPGGAREPGHAPSGTRTLSMPTDA